MREHVQGDPALAWALEPAERPDGLARFREKLHLIGIPLLLLPLLPLLLFLPVVAVILRLHERRDVARHVKPEQSRVLELAALEDHIVQNPFMAVGHVKPGLFRSALLTVILFGLNFGTRHIFNRGDLSGVKTIHFARWVFLDGKRRMFFASNYDGSMESYMDDFIDKVAWGLNLVFSNGVNYPKTSWLIFGGAKNELAFKDLLRVQQVPNPVWYSAYGDLTALNIAQNERIRAGLRERGRSRVGAVAVTLELGDVQGLFARGYGDLKSAAFLLLRVDDAAAARRSLGETIATSAEDRRPEHAVNIAFTSSGLERLGFPGRTLWRRSRTSSSPG